MKLYFILSTNLMSVLEIETIGNKAIDGGVDWIQFRHKDPYTEEIFEIAKKIGIRCRENKIPFLINDRFDIALALDADGVHLGQEDLPLADVRLFLKKRKIIGQTTPDLDTMKRAHAWGANYACIGHIFPTSTKIKSSPPLGVEKVQEAALHCPLPLFAIGGIDLQNIALLLAAPIAGVAVSAGICNAVDPTLAVQQFKQKLQYVHA